jgi:GNAT superfamily N-acetyltransferase
MSLIQDLLCCPGSLVRGRARHGWSGAGPFAAAIVATGALRLVVLAPPLDECDWRAIRDLIGRTERDDLAKRFLRTFDFGDGKTVKRLLDIPVPGGEIVLAIEPDAAAAGMLHRIPVSASEAEIALLVRSNRKRRGIGSILLSDAIVWGRARKLQRLSALASRDNIAVMRLARQFGFVWRSSAGPSVELELDLNLNQASGGRAAIA